MSDYKVVSSSSLAILEAGAQPPAECKAVGAVAIPTRKVSFVDRHFGFAEEEFSRSLEIQTEPLKATLLVPKEGSDFLAAASSGDAFQATAYACP